MKCLKGSQTEKNLVIAFAGESQARNRYNYFAGAARKEGLMQIAAISTKLKRRQRCVRLVFILKPISSYSARIGNRLCANCLPCPANYLPG
jgi:hypothetical protein